MQKLTAMKSGEKEDIRLSKFLSLVLRHQPEIIGLELDNQGWTSIDTLLEKAAKANVLLSLAQLRQIVLTNNKKRFSFDETGTRIRANQGHSVAVELGYQPQKPPAVLYHGTAIRFLQSILANGLIKKHRHHVHLSLDPATARQVGQRHGQPIVLQVQAQAMYHQGFPFYLSDNKVWLTEVVPAQFLEIHKENE